MWFCFQDEQLCCSRARWFIVFQPSCKVFCCSGVQSVLWHVLSKYTSTVLSQIVNVWCHNATHHSCSLSSSPKTYTCHERYICHKRYTPATNVTSVTNITHLSRTLLLSRTLHICTNVTYLSRTCRIRVTLAFAPVPCPCRGVPAQKTVSPFLFSVLKSLDRYPSMCFKVKSSGRYSILLRYPANDRQQVLSLSCHLVLSEINELRNDHLSVSQNCIIQARAVPQINCLLGAKSNCIIIYTWEYFTLIPLEDLKQKFPSIMRPIALLCQLWKLTSFKKG